MYLNTIITKNHLLLITRIIQQTLYNSNARITEKKIVRITESSKDGKLKLVKCIRVKPCLRKASLKSCKWWMFLFFEPNLVQKKVLEGLQHLGDAFKKNKIFELHNSKFLKSKNTKKNPELSNSEIFYLIKIFDLVNSVFFIFIFLL